MQIKTTMRYQLRSFRTAITKKTRSNKCWQERGEKGTLVHCWWECKLVQPLWKRVWRFLEKSKIEPPYNPAIPLLGMYLKKMKLLFWKDIFTPMFTAALFIRAKWWKQSKRPSVNEWLAKENAVCIYTMD